MILYEKRFGAFNLLLRIYGSTWPRALILAIPGTVFAALLRAFLADQIEGHLFLHPYPYSVFATVLAFVIIFRTNLSYQRYWEGRTMVAQMSSKWADAAIQVVAFDERASESAAPGGTQFRLEFVHTMSLMHAIAMQRLRGDNDLSNLSYASFVDIPEPPPVDPAFLLEWSRKRSLKSYVILRVKEHHFEKYWRTLPLPVIGGTNATEVGILGRDSEPVYVIFCWLHRQLVARRMAGGIREDAPIVSRIYQVLSDGMLGYENARKLCDTPFPFPYAQCCSLLLHLNSLGLPLLMANWVGEAWLTALVTFVGIFAFHLINEVAREIEEPFKYDPNEIPVAHLHYKFNARLVAALVGSLMPPEGLFRHISDKDVKPRIKKARPVCAAESVDLEAAQGGANHWAANLAAETVPEMPGPPIKQSASARQVV